MNPVYVSITPGDVCATQALLRMSTGNKAEYEDASGTLVEFVSAQTLQTFQVLHLFGVSEHSYPL
jgi:hypothetical protein